MSTFRSSSKAGFGKVPDLARGKVPEDWWYFPVVARLHSERTGYPTQKPEALMERIILASSNPGDLVADFFCGSGTTPAVAARRGRCFLAADSAWRAVHTTRGRLIRSEQPFSIEVAANALVSLPPPPATRLRVTRDSVEIDTHLDLDFWEVDPAWDGRIFRSAAQAVRGTRSAAIARKLEIKCGRIACVRMVTVDGKSYQLEVQPIADAPDGF